MRIGTRWYIVLERYDMTASKRRKKLGQHFLTDTRVIEDIVSLIRPQPGETIVEIGPGRGALTRHLASPRVNLHAIEVDPFLTERLLQDSCAKSVTLHQADVLQFDLSTIKRKDRKLRIVGNLPYSISTPLMFRLMQYANIIEDMCFMVQYEVARRLTAKCGSSNYGRLTVSIGRIFEVESVFDVSADAFSPPPDVRSSVILMRPRQLPETNLERDSVFSELVRLAFGNRRKTLRNSLGQVIDEAMFREAGIDAGLRAQNLTVKHFVDLAQCAVSNANNKPDNWLATHD